METINYEDLYFIDSNPHVVWGSGSFGNIRRCIFNDKKYVYKEFKNIRYLKNKKRKLFKLSKIDVPGLIVPKYWVKKQGVDNSYLTVFEDKDNLNLLPSKSLQTKYKTLQNAKELILTMHNHKIIHGDLHCGNILSKNELCSIIDFDNSSYGKYKIKVKDVNDYSIEFIKKYGIKPEVDIFIFNILTYYMINEVEKYSLVRQKIHQDKYGYFNNKDGIQICKSLFLDDKIPNKDFLIDTIDETTFSI